jgi:hypothetical protein
MNVNELILDYIAMCEKFGELSFEDFIEVWTVADEIARTGNFVSGEYSESDE